MNKKASFRLHQVEVEVDCAHCPNKMLLRNYTELWVSLEGAEEFVCHKCRMTSQLPIKLLRLMREI